LKKKTIGFYGGTFDPIHFGHINLAVQLLEIHPLDEVLFCPAYCSPFKTAAPPRATPQQRLEMVKIALEGIPRFRITTYEIDRNDPSFTIDTLQMIKKEGKGEVNFRLLLSEEAASHFDQWKNFQDLIRLAPPIIGTRSSSILRGSLADSLRSGYTPTKIFEISSTDIRARLKKGLYCGHLVPEKVLDYIQTNGLYKI
jgi:nicotinate-nucleotide adenylyltransferase